MEKEKIIFTDEMLNTLFERCKQHCLAKYNQEIDHVQIEKDYICGYYSIYHWGQTDYETIEMSIDEVNNEDYDILIEERLEKERIKREKEKERVRLAQIEYNKRKAREEMEQYLTLKKKFEK
jgi:hypothetical protein